METLLKVPQGCFELRRIPQRHNELLRAWDAADEYLLNYLAEEALLENDSRILILNDDFGALTVALNIFTRTCLSDSYLSHEATRLNLTANNLSEDNIQFLSSLDTPHANFDLVLLKVPKTLALLEDQLIRLQNIITPSTQIIATGMVKSLPSSVWKLFERLLGTTTSSLAKKKARLIFITPYQGHNINDKNLLSPYPVYYQLENTHFQICNHANVFSRDSLDIGTRFLLENLPALSDSLLVSKTNNIIDLGCGNGVVGLMISEKYPDATIHFIDESYMAIASAKETFGAALGDSHRATFQVNDALTMFEDNSADLIICNPPFHQQHSIGDQISSRMFRQSQKVLKKRGELWVIGNRHLNYHKQLKHLFGNVKIVSSNTKFMICKTIA